MRIRQIPFPPINLQACLDPDHPDHETSCAELRRQACDYGIAMLSVEGVTPSSYALVRAMMESYWSQPKSALDLDVRPQHHRQVGRMEAYCETAMPYPERLAALEEDQRPYPHAGPNPLERFFWRFGSRPSTSNFPERHADPVIPERFEREWEPVMNSWGEIVLDTLFDLAEALEFAFRLPPGTMVKKLQAGPHLISPTGCNILELLAKRCHKPVEELSFALRQAASEDKLRRINRNLNLSGAVVSHYHDDFNPITIHGPANMPGLICWARNGDPFTPEIPPGCLFAQFGAQTEHLFAGGLHEDGPMAGMHQVVVTWETLKVLWLRLKLGLPPIRVSSTFFGHGNADQPLEVLPPFRVDGWRQRYPSTTFGAHSAAVIEKIGLAAQEIAG